MGQPEVHKKLVQPLFFFLIRPNIFVKWARSHRTFALLQREINSVTPKRRSAIFFFFRSARVPATMLGAVLEDHGDLNSPGTIELHEPGDLAL